DAALLMVGGALLMLEDVGVDLGTAGVANVGVEAACVQADPSPREACPVGAVNAGLHGLHDEANRGCDGLVPSSARAWVNAVAPRPVTRYRRRRGRPARTAMSGSS